MANKPDFGPFGKGLEGYVHYRVAIDHINKDNNGGKGGGGGNNNGGCLSLFVLLAIGGWLVTALFR